MNALLGLEHEGRRMQLHLGTDLQSHSFYSEHPELWDELCDAVRHIAKTHMRANLKTEFKPKEVTRGNHGPAND